MASLATVVSSVLRVVMRTNSNLVRDLERDSQTLDRLRDNFCLILAKGGLSVWSFEEELAMPGVGKVHYLLL
jgi:protein SERAC1